MKHWIFYWVLLCLGEALQILNTLPSPLPSSVSPSRTCLGEQASRESLSTSLSGDVSEAGLSSHQGALGAPVVPQPSGSPAAAAAAPVPATPSKVGHWKRDNFSAKFHSFTWNSWQHKRSTRGLLNIIFPAFPSPFCLYFSITSSC